MTATQTPPQAEGSLARRDSFAGTLRAEWTKFRTVRGWVIGMIVAALVTVGIGLLSAAGSMSSCSINGKPCHILHPVGPGGEAVTDTLLLRAPAAGQPRQHHRAGDLADRRAAHRDGRPGPGRPGRGVGPAPRP